MNINLKSDKLLFLHKGTITKELIELVVEALEQSVTNLEPNRMVRRKITNVFIEVFQNIGYHGVKDPRYSSSDMVIVLSMPAYYKIGTVNLIHKADKDAIGARIDYINTLSPEELREEHKATLSNGSVSEKGTAGLGFYDIARKTGQKLYYQFEDVDDEYTFFHFETRVVKLDEEDEPRSQKASKVAEE